MLWPCTWLGRRLASWQTWARTSLRCAVCGVAQAYRHASTRRRAALSTPDWPQVYKLSKKSEEFAQFLRDPSVPKAQKSAVLQDVLDTAKVSDITKNFFSAPPLATLGSACTRAGGSPETCAAGVLAENNRLNLFHKIMGSFFELVSAEIGQVACTITSAEVLAGSVVSAQRPAVGLRFADHGSQLG